MVISRYNLGRTDSCLSDEAIDDTVPYPTSSSLAPPLMRLSPVLVPCSIDVEEQQITLEKKRRFKDL